MNEVPAKTTQPEETVPKTAAAARPAGAVVSKADRPLSHSEMYDLHAKYGSTGQATCPPEGGYCE